MRRFKYIVLATLLVTPPTIYAQDGSLNQTTINEAQELEQLLELLEEQTTIATKTRLNADYVPGMVTVLHGDDLSSRGAHTVWDALGFVPGITLSIEEAGRKQVVIRGIGRTYASGNTKILLNGTSMNTANLAHANPVMNIPVEQVERIEVIRGPGSAIHGEFALIGVINVITHKNSEKVYISGGENSSTGFGIMLRSDPDASPVHLSLNLSNWQTNGPEVIAGEDELYIENGGANAINSNAPGRTNEAAEDSTGILRLDYKDFSLTAQWLKDGYGDHFGRNQFLPPDEKRIVTSNEYKTLELTQKFQLDSHWHAKLYAGWQENKLTKDDLYTGPESGITPWNDPYDPALVFHVDTHYKEHRSNVGVDINWTDKSTHDLLLNIEYNDIKVDDVLNEYQQAGVTIFDWPTISQDKRRRILSTTLQDEIRINNQLTVTAGIRYDDYNDIDAEASPRLAAVWRKDQKNIFKAQYASAFRPPTFYELSAAAYNYFPATYDQVKGTTIDTLELGYIHKNINTDYLVTAFYSEIDQFIIFIDQTGFANTDSARMSGLELEVKHRTNNFITLDSNISYVNTDDTNSGRSIPGSANWIGNFSILLSASSNTDIALRHNIVGEIYREPADTRSKLDSYRTTDMTISINDMFNKNLDLLIGIKNLLNKEVKYPAPLLTYTNDHARAGSQWWMQMSYKF